MRTLLVSLLVAMTALLLFVVDEPSRIERVINHASNSVVFVSIVGEQGQGSCSGEVVAANRVLTAKHCVGSHMWADGVAAEVLSKDDYYDLALLKVETARPALSLRDTDVVRGEEVVGIGYAFGWDQLVAIHCRVVLPNIIPYDKAAPGIILQTEFIGGMSGGPVIDGYGRMVSIVQQGNKGVSYGMSVDIIRAFLRTTDVGF